jgi:hypothetical protein
MQAAPCGTSDDVFLAPHSVMLLRRVLLWLVGEVEVGCWWLF